MTDADQIVIGLIQETREQLREAKKAIADQEARTEAHLERLAGRAIFKIGLVGGVSVIATIVAAVITITSYFSKINTTIALQQYQLQQHTDELGQLPAMRADTLEAKRVADKAENLITGHLSPDGLKVKK